MDAQQIKDLAAKVTELLKAKDCGAAEELEDSVSTACNREISK